MGSSPHSWTGRKHTGATVNGKKGRVRTVSGKSSAIIFRDRAMTEQTAAAAPPAPYTLWSVVRDAVRGVPHDYTAGSIGRAIVLLAIPMVLEMAMESIFAVVDVFWVSRLCPDAVATVGLTESMLTLVYTAAMGLSIGVAAVVARRIGEKRPDAAAAAAVQGIALGLAVAAGVAGLRDRESGG